MFKHRNPKFNQNHLVPSPIIYNIKYGREVGPICEIHMLCFVRYSQSMLIFDIYAAVLFECSVFTISLQCTYIPRQLKFFYINNQNCFIIFEVLYLIIKIRFLIKKIIILIIKKGKISLYFL